MEVRYACKRRYLRIHSKWINIQKKRYKVKEMKTVFVVAAVIMAERDNERIVFATQRGYGNLKGGWEFPGGKVEKGETPQQALEREIMEELDTEISVGDLIGTIEYDYPTFHLSMGCYESDGQMIPVEVKAVEEFAKSYM